jgi:hypothetical protein
MNTDLAIRFTDLSESTTQNSDSPETNENNKKIFSLIQITSQENILLKYVESFYLELKDTTDFFEILKSDSKVSIRLIDYFVTKYSKKNKIIYYINNSLFNIYQSYKQQLKAFQKRYFDPFARGNRIPYFIGTYCIITTIGQLNFFKWFISKNILDYVLKNKESIEIEMNKSKKIKLSIKIKNPRKTKYNEVKICSYTPNQTVKVKNNILVTF